MENIFYAQDIEQMDKQYRINFINSLVGVRPAILLGTKNNETGIENLALINSITHIGANPAMMGYIARPIVDKGTHSLKNILQNGFYSFNHIPSSLYQDVHQTSARYEENDSEFEACGFNPQYHNNFTVPFVKEATIQIGLELVEQHQISNGCRLIVGKIVLIHLNQKEILDSEGFISHNGLLSGGLQDYYTPQFLSRLPYAKI